MNSKVASILLILSPCFAYGMGERLIGDWKSDGPRTMAYLRQQNRFSEVQLKRLEALIGQMTMSYDGKHMHAEMRGKSEFDADYRVIGDAPKMIIIEETDSKTLKKDQDKLRFEGDAYWVSDERVPGFAECFVRVQSVP